MVEGKQTVQGGIGSFELLTVVFIVLKLTKVIDWSWWWVLAPTWGSVALIIVFIILQIILHIKD